jgi:hypothetical protein
MILKGNSRKINIRKYIKQIAKMPHMVLLEQRNKETKKWEIAYADVTVILKDYGRQNENSTYSADEYKYIGFDIHFFN